MSVLHLALLVSALILFAIATFAPNASGRLVPAGLACVTLAYLLTRFYVAGSTLAP